MNKLFVYLIYPYVIRINGKKETLSLKSVNMIYHVTGWIEITQYYDKRAISITNLVETKWLTTYNLPMEIMYDKVT